VKHPTAPGRNGPEIEIEGQAEAQPSITNQPNYAVRHAVADPSIVASCRRPLPQEMHADLGIVDDGSAVGA
jgi:hypothetical protein